jgi:hypothetical protein
MMRRALAVIACHGRAATGSIFGRPGRAYIPGQPVRLTALDLLGAITLVKNGASAENAAASSRPLRRVPLDPALSRCGAFRDLVKHS